MPPTTAAAQQTGTDTRWTKSSRSTDPHVIGATCDGQTDQCARHMVCRRRRKSTSSSLLQQQGPSWPSAWRQEHRHTDRQTHIHTDTRIAHQSCATARHAANPDDRHVPLHVADQNAVVLRRTSGRTVGARCHGDVGDVVARLLRPQHVDENCERGENDSMMMMTMMMTEIWKRKRTIMQGLRQSFRGMNYSHFGDSRTKKAK